jgi:hypothetical protein
VPGGKKTKKPLKAYEFLKERAQDQKPFTVQELSKGSCP